MSIYRSVARETGGLDNASAGQSRALAAAAVSPESEIGANERTPTAGGVTRSNGHVKTHSPASVVPAGIWVGDRAFDAALDFIEWLLAYSRGGTYHSDDGEDELSTDVLAFLRTHRAEAAPSRSGPIYGQTEDDPTTSPVDPT